MLKREGDSRIKSAQNYQTFKRATHYYQTWLQGIYLFIYSKAHHIVKLIRWRPKIKTDTIPCPIPLYFGDSNLNFIVNTL